MKNVYIVMVVLGLSVVGLLIGSAVKDAIVAVSADRVDYYASKGVLWEDANRRIVVMKHARTFLLKEKTCEY